MSFLGIGPGRCGTMSLAKYLNGCRNTWAIHEEYRIALAILDVVSATSRGGWEPRWNIGFIGLAWTRWVDKFRVYVPDAPVICLHRPKDEVVASFARTAITKMSETGFGEAEIPDEKSTAMHWERCEEVMAQVAEPVLHVETKQLSGDATITRIFDFVRVPAAHRRMPEQKVWNTREAQCKANEKRAAIHGHETETAKWSPWTSQA